MNWQRDTVFDTMLASIGWVPCYVCGGRVKRKEATLEHVIPRSKGGTDDADNLSISHQLCNSRRGNEITRSASPLSEKAVGASCNGPSDTTGQKS